MRLRVAIALGVVAAVGALVCLVGFVMADGAGDRVTDYPALEAGAHGEVELDDGEQIGWYESDCFGCDGRESVFTAPRLRIDGAEVTPYGEAREARYSEG